jgi:hypothetical protein
MEFDPKTSENAVHITKIVLVFPAPGSEVQKSTPPKQRSSILDIKNPEILKHLRRSTKTSIFARFQRIWVAVYKPVYKHPVHKPKFNNCL